MGCVCSRFGSPASSAAAAASAPAPAPAPYYPPNSSVPRKPVPTGVSPPARPSEARPPRQQHVRERLAQLEFEQDAQERERATAPKELYGAGEELPPILTKKVRVASSVYSMLSEDTLSRAWTEDRKRRPGTDSKYPAHLKSLNDTAGLTDSKRREFLRKEDNKEAKRPIDGRWVHAPDLFGDTKRNTWMNQGYEGKLKEYLAVKEKYEKENPGQKLF